MADHLDLIASEGKLILELGRRDPWRPVPQYKGWTMNSLMEHLGAVMGRTSLVCRDRLTERPKSPRPDSGADVADWYQERLAELLEVLGTTDHGVPVWGFIDNSVVGTWVIRMVVETGVHRWDAEQAFGDPEPLRDEVAVTALDEFTHMWHPRLGEVDPIALDATDLGRRWLYGEGAPMATVAATASDLYLRLMSRPSPAPFPPDWVRAVDSLAPPPK